MRLNELESILTKYQPYDLAGEVAHRLAFPKFRLELYLNTKPTEKTRKSAILILFYEKESEIYFCLIKRPKYEGHHSGQIAFPGGKFEVKDGDLRTTALREANEEIGIDLNNVHIVNKLTTLFIPISDFIVKPFIAVAKTTPTFTPSSHEVEYLISIRLTDLLSTPLKETEVYTPKEPIVAPAFTIENEKIWGATAMILSELKELLVKVTT